MTSHHKPHDEFALQRELARMEVMRAPRFTRPGRLASHGAKYFSQGDEDGLIAELFRRIGERSRYFVEIGAGDGAENNTMHLLLNGWNGLWIEADQALAARAITRFAPLVQSGQLRVACARVTPDNVNALASAHGTPREIDLLSIDIDGNDYYVFEALEACKPRAAVLEYNAGFGPAARWVMPYASSGAWDETLVFGASLASFCDLGARKELTLVGCNVIGTNAFFVADAEILDRFQGPFTATEHFEPARYFLLPMAGGHRFPPDAGDSRLALGMHAPEPERA